MMTPDRPLTLADSHDHRPVPARVWWLLGAVVLIVWIESLRGASDAMWWHPRAVAAWQGNWSAVYNRDVDGAAISSYVPISQAILLAPFGALPLPVFRVLLTFIILAGWLLFYQLFAHSIPRRPLGFRGSIPLASMAPLLGMIVAHRFISNDLENNQLNFLYLVLSCLGLRLMLPPFQPVWASAGAMSLACGIGLKLVPFIFLVMLVLKRAWKEAALTTACAALLLYALPAMLMGADEYAAYRAHVASSTGGLWMYHHYNHLLFSLSNVLMNHVYVHPLWPGLADTPPRIFQLIMAGCTVVVGLPALWVLLQCPWRRLDPLRLWEDIAVVGAAWVIVDPIGEIAHSVMVAPACCLICYRRLALWHDRGQAPARWEWTAFLFITFSNLILFRISLLGGHAFYRVTGLYTLGQLTLYGMTVLDVLRARRAESATHQVANSAEALPECRIPAPTAA